MTESSWTNDPGTSTSYGDAEAEDMQAFGESLDEAFDVGYALGYRVGYQKAVAESYPELAALPELQE